MCDLFLFTNDTDIAYYSDENTFYASENTTCKVFEWLEEFSGDTFYLVSKKNTSATVTFDNLKIDISGVKIESNLKKKLLGVIIDNFLTFKSHICSMLKKATIIFIIF